MSDKPTNQEIIKLKSRLLFLRDKTNTLGAFIFLIYVGAIIVALFFKINEYLAAIFALGLLNGSAFLDKSNGLEEQYKTLNRETITDKGVQDV